MLNEIFCRYRTFVKMKEDGLFPHWLVYHPDLVPDDLDRKLALEIALGKKKLKALTNTPHSSSTPDRGSSSTAVVPARHYTATEKKILKNETPAESAKRLQKKLQEKAKNLEKKMNAEFRKEVKLIEKQKKALVAKEKARVKKEREKEKERIRKLKEKEKKVEEKN